MNRAPEASADSLGTTLEKHLYRANFQKVFFTWQIFVKHLAYIYYVPDTVQGIFFFPSLQNLIPTGPPRCILNLVNHPAQ